MTELNFFLYSDIILSHTDPMGQLYTHMQSRLFVSRSH